jgi:hypothetical protein
LTEDGRWCDRTAAALAIIAGEGAGADGYEFCFSDGYAVREPIHIACLDGFVPMALDLLASQLAPDLMTRVRQYVREQVVQFRRHILAANLSWFSMSCNKFWHQGVVYVWALAAVYDAECSEDREMMDEAVDLVRTALHRGVDDAGAIGEGPNYGGHDAWRWASCADLFRRLGVVDMWQDEPRLSAMLSHPIDLLLPGGHGMANRGDGNADHRNFLWPLLLHAHRTGDPQAQYAWERLGGRTGIGPAGVDDTALRPLGFHLLWDSDARQAEQPTAATRPLDKAPGCFGEALMRSGWGEEDAFACLLAAGRHPGCFLHQHDDAGHFSFYALGEAFSIDTGYGDAAARHHTLMMPGGAEPSAVHEPGQNCWAGGHNHAFGSCPTGGYAAVDIGWQWNCFYFYRHALLVRLPGTEPYAVLLDDCSTPSDCTFYDWILNTAPGNRIITTDSAAAVIQGRKNRLEISWATAAPEGFTEPPRLDVSQDRLRSDFELHGQTLGVGERPRLTARLHCPVGTLLTALVPRRAGSPPAVVESINTRAVLGLTVDHGACTDTILAAPSDGRLRAGAIAGEGTLAVVRHDRNGAPVGGLLANGYALTVAGDDVVPRSGRSQPLQAW